MSPAPPVPAASLGSAGHAELLLAALVGITTVVLVILWAKFHPLLGLVLGTAVLGADAGRRARGGPGQLRHRRAGDLRRWGCSGCSR